jgi:hypothetical protein
MPKLNKNNPEVILPISKDLMETKNRKGLHAKTTN